MYDLIQDVFPKDEDIKTQGQTYAVTIVMVH